MSSNKGYGLLHRKFFDHELWQEPRVFSRAEAWIDVVFCIARGTNSREVKRGQFRASLTWLGSRWGWDKTKVARFIGWLLDKDMVQRVHAEGKDIRVYLVVNYEKLQNPQHVVDENSPHYAVTPSDTPSDTSTVTATDTLEPAPVVVLPPMGDTPSDTSTVTASDTPRDTNRNERLNTGGKKSIGDVPFESFKLRFELHRKIPYRHKTADFVQIAALRKAMNVPARASPPGWDIAEANYFASVLSVYTLGDLCSRYDVFLESPVDRYGKPIGGKHVQRESEAEAKQRRTREASERLLARIAEQVGGGVPAGADGADPGGVPRRIGGSPFEPN